MRNFPLEKAFTLIEPGPVVMITTCDGKKNNIMTISWITVKEFTPEFVMVTGPWNHSFNALIKSQECVIAIPADDISEKVIKAGTCSGADTDKFKKFELTPVKSKYIQAPLIKECLGNIECLVTDHIKKHNIFILKGINAWTEPKLKDKKTLHALGNGTFILDGQKINCRKLMSHKIPEGL